MANDSNDFYYELKAHLESFRHQETPHEVPVTIKGVPREGLTIKYQHPSTRPADPADMASEAARVIGAVGIGTAGGAAVGAIIGSVGRNTGSDRCSLCWRSNWYPHSRTSGPRWRGNLHGSLRGLQDWQGQA